jgi:dTDP-4-amino-4,6-dideoxygalactose transaminase
MIKVFGSYSGPEEARLVKACLDRQWLGEGPFVAEFERAFSQRNRLPGLVMVDSCSNGLYLACKLLELPPDSEIIVPTFTWVGCAQAVLLAGHRPVFADVEYDTGNVSARLVADAAGPKTAAIMVVHYAGLPVDLVPLKEFGLPIIEDAAHAVDSRYQGGACGGHGLIGVYSFDSMKNLAIGEAGGLTSTSPELLRRARALKNSGVARSGFGQAQRGGLRPGRWWEHEVSDVFIKATTTDVAAAIGLAQLGKLCQLQQRRAEIWRIYQETLKDLPWLETPAEARPGDRHSYFTYLVRTELRDQLASDLLAKGIYTTLRFSPLHLIPFFACRRDLPNAERLAETALNLPLHPGLSMDDLGRIIEALREFGRTH